MSNFFAGEIQIFGFDFPPKNWAKCNGQLLSIAQNQALFALLGTTYGGNGTTTFALPDLRSRLPMGQGTGPGLSGRVIGEVIGTENHTLLTSENPLHTHAVQVVSNQDVTKNVDVPGSSQFLAKTTYNGNTVGGETLIYVADSSPSDTMHPSAIGSVGGLPHSNLMPLLALNFCIALTGIFPTRN